MKLDHLVWASNSLDAAVADFERLSGVSAGAGGRHPTIGSQNALVDLGDGCYLAIDGPDPEQTLEGNYGAYLSGLAVSTLWRFAVQTEDLGAAERVLSAHGCETAVTPGGRSSPSGLMLKWDTLAVSGHDFGVAMPIIKTWRTDAHPSADAPRGCRLVSLTVSHPRAAALRRLYDDLGIAVTTEEGPTPALTAVIDGGRGRFTLPPR